MATIQRFEDLDLWKRAREIDKEIFTITLNTDFSKDFRFIDQIRAASGSIMDNIAECFDRDENKEFVLFLGYLKGSAGEVRSQLYRAFDWSYITEDFLNQYINNLLLFSKSLNGFISYLKKSEYKGNKFK